MKAITVTENGAADVLRLREAELPAPQDNEAQVRIHAAGVNFVDIYQRRGDYPVPLPFTPGMEAAGEVAAVGSAVKDFKPGDRVAYTSTSLGAYAEASNVPADVLIPLPDDISYEQGAAFPLQAMTAHYLLHEFRRPKTGETVLIHAAAGGMGLLLVQWAKHLGARVIGTVSTKAKADAAREAGADDMILYTEQDFVAETKRLTGGRGAELIIDGVGKTTFAGNLEAAALRGNIVIYGWASGLPEPLAPVALTTKSLTLSGGNLYNYINTRDELLSRAHAALEGIRDGWLKLRVDHVLPLAEVAEAHRLLESRATVGKIVLQTGA